MNYFVDDKHNCKIVYKITANIIQTDPKIQPFPGSQDISIF